MNGRNNQPAPVSLTSPRTELYQATASDAYLADACTIADAVLSSAATALRLTQDGILTETACEPDESSGCNHDQQVFKPGRSRVAAAVAD